MLETQVEVVLAFGKGRGVERAWRFGAGADELRQRLVGDEFERWRREVARIADVHGGAGGRLPHQAGARAKLAFATERAVVIVTQPGVERERRRKLPFVLHIAAEGRAVLATVVDDLDRLAGLRAIGIEREYRGVGAAERAVVLDKEPAAQRMRIARLVRGIELEPEREIAFERGLRLPVEQQFAQHIGTVAQRGIASEAGDLQRQRSRRVEQRHLPEASSFDLRLVKAVRQEITGPAHDITRTDCCCRKPARIGDLEPLVRITAKHADTVRIVEDAIDEREALELVGGVVQRRTRPVDAFDAQVVVAIIARHEVAGRARRAAIFEGRFDRALAAAIDRSGAAVGQARLGGDVDHPGGAQPVLRGQRAGQQRELFDQPRRQRLPEARQPLGQDGAVDAVLQVAVIAAHVQLARAVLHHAWQLQHDLVETLVSSAGQRGDRLVVERVAVCAQAGLNRIARGVEPVRGDHDRRSGIGARVWCGIGSRFGHSVACRRSSWRAGACLRCAQRHGHATGAQQGAGRHRRPR